VNRTCLVIGIVMFFVALGLLAGRYLHPERVIWWIDFPLVVVNAIGAGVYIGLGMRGRR
jgi:hypothetical protein